MSESAAFEDLGLFGTKRNVDNEVLVFKSRRLMTEVARNLHLDVSYTVKDGLRTVELYTQSPVQLSFPDAEEAQAFSLKAVLSPERRWYCPDSPSAGGRWRTASR